MGKQYKTQNNSPFTHGIKGLSEIGKVKASIFGPA